MQIVVNGQGQEAPEGISIPALLKSVGVEPRKIAIELNGRVVASRDFDRVALRDRDRVEIVQFVGGG